MATTTKQPNKELDMKRNITRLLVPFAIAAMLFGTACEKEQTKEDEAQTETNATQTTEIPAEYKAEAAAEITAENADEAAAELEAEIEADLAE